MGETKTAIVTGACGGIGMAIASCFQEAGYHVVATDQFETAVAGLLCDKYLSADLAKTVTNSGYANAIFQKIKEISPPDSIHVLINNAAVQVLGGLDDLTVEDWKHTLNINLLAPFVWSQGLASEIEKEHGSIINIGSIHARLTKKGFVAYATSKAALAGMTRALAIDVGPRIRINAIEPAAIETKMLKAGFKENEEGYRQLKNFHPVGRIGHCEEVAKVALFLASNEVGFAHGTTFPLDGGIGTRLFDPE